MSYLSEQDSVCSYCQHPNEAEVWSVINVKDDPELKDILLGGELNMAECAACRKIFYAEHFLLYHDPDAELMAFVYPYDHRSDRAVWEEKTTIDFDAAQKNAEGKEIVAYAPVTLFGLDELVRMVEQEEEAGLQGDIVEALAKEHHFSVIKIAPAQARKFKIPRVLPSFAGNNVLNQETLLDALERLEKINNNLSVYANLKNTVRAQALFPLPEKFK